MRSLLYHSFSFWLLSNLSSIQAFFLFTLEIWKDSSQSMLLCFQRENKTDITIFNHVEAPTHK